MFFVSVTSVDAKTINLSSVHTYIENDIYYLDAAFDLQLSEEAQKALRHGIAIEIHTEFQLYEKRNWLWDKKVNQIILMYRLEHHPLTEDYLTVDLITGVRSSYISLEGAINHISSISKMALFDKSVLDKEQQYNARIRSYIDLESLPTPIRPQSYFSSNWNISSKWHEWEIDQ